jgi:prophage sa05, DNA-binding protein
MNRLKELRQEKKLSQKEIAETLGFSLRSFQRMENGESQIKPEKAQKLADYFGVSVGYLLGYNDNLDMVLKGRGTDMADLPNILVATKIDFLNDKKEIEKLKRETLASIQFIESIVSTLARYEIAKEGTYSLKLEQITNVLLDFYNTLERQEKNMGKDPENLDILVY